MHLDGAPVQRCHEPTPGPHGHYATGTPIYQHFDTASLCLSRPGAPVGSHCCWAAPTIHKPSAPAKSWGGAIRRCGMLATRGHHALQHHVRRLADDHALLRQLAAGMARPDAATRCCRGRWCGLGAHQHPFTDVDYELAPALSAWLARHGAAPNCAGSFRAERERVGCAIPRATDRFSNRRYVAQTAIDGISMVQDG